MWYFTTQYFSLYKFVFSNYHIYEMLHKISNSIIIHIMFQQNNEEQINNIIEVFWQTGNTDVHVGMTQN